MAPLEMVLCLPILVFMFVLCVWMANFFITQARLTANVRNAAWQKRYTTEVVAQTVQMLGGRGERGPEDSAATVPPDDAGMAADFGPGPDDDIPF